MTYPVFFDSVRKITLRDPLAELLGASEGGVLEYGFTDVVKLAGHSCPTVAGAYLMTFKALAALYGKEMPVRGNIRVSFRDRQDNTALLICFSSQRRWFVISGTSISSVETFL